jgi:hypothetical protein
VKIFSFPSNQNFTLFSILLFMETNRAFVHLQGWPLLLHLYQTSYMPVDQVAISCKGKISLEYAI